MTDKQRDTPQQLRTIYATLARHGIYGEAADRCLNVATGLDYTTPSEILDEANKELGIDPLFTSFTTWVWQLVRARGNMSEFEYNSACSRRFGPDGVRFAILAPSIYDALEEEDPDVFRKPQGEGRVRLGFSNPRTGSVERTGTDENGNGFIEIKTHRK